MKILKGLFIGLSLLTFISCSEDDQSNLPPFEERVDEAVAALEADLMAPGNGWRLEYKPTPNSGVFLILLEFVDDEQVIIKSDIADNNGEFFEDTITWRIDNRLGLELIFDTYGVFHYLFEQDNATFGAEFQWIFNVKNGSDLFFYSKNDLSPIVLQPAGPNDENEFSREISENLNFFNTLSPNALVAVPPGQQLILNDLGASVFWSLNSSKRTINATFAGEGTSIEEVISNGGTLLNHQSGYILANGGLELTEPLEFIANGTFITIERIIFNDFSLTGTSLCPSGPDDAPVYSGTVLGAGSATMVASLFDQQGAISFVPDNVYSISSSFFVFDENNNSIGDGGLIDTLFPDVGGIIIFYEFNSGIYPDNSVGLVLDNPDGSTDIYVREFIPVQNGNKLMISLTGNFYHSGTPQAGDETNLTTITDLLFEGGEIYAFGLNYFGTDLFDLINPCNGIEIILL